MTSKQASKATASVKTDPTEAKLDAVYAFTGRGKSRVYMAALPQGQGNPGDLVKLHTSYKGLNLGRLVSIVSVADGFARWNFERVPMTAEQVAMNRQLKAEAQAAFWSSDKGSETAAKIAARQIKADSDAMAIAQEIAPVVANETPSTAAASVGRVALISDLKAAGFSLSDIMAEVAKLSATVTSTPAPKQATSTPAAKVLAPKPTTKAKATDGKQVCGSCAKQVTTLYQHVAGVLVCDPCMNQDASTVTTRHARLVAKGTVK